MATIKTQFHFRSIPSPTLTAVPAGIKPATKAQAEEFNKYADQFENGSADFRATDGSVHSLAAIKRKSVEAELQMPDFYESLPDDMARSLIAAHVERFVRTEYVERFAPVGAHDWETIARVLAERAANRPGGSSLPEASDADKAAADAFFLGFYQKVAPKFAPRVKGWIVAGCAHRKTDGVLGEVTEPRADNLAQRLAQASEQVKGAIAAKVGTAEQQAEFAAIARGLALATEMLVRYKAVRFAPKEIVGDDEM